jgi:hypothetical protein
MAWFYLGSAVVLAVVGLFTPQAFPFPHLLTACQIFLFLMAFQRARHEHSRHSTPVA